MFLGISRNLSTEKKYFSFFLNVFNRFEGDVIKHIDMATSISINKYYYLQLQKSNINIIF